MSTFSQKSSCFVVYAIVLQVHQDPLSRISGRGYKIGPVCLCVRLLVIALTADVRTQNLVEG